MGLTQGIGKISIEIQQMLNFRAVAKLYFLSEEMEPKSKYTITNISQFKS